MSGTDLNVLIKKLTVETEDGETLTYEGGLGRVIIHRIAEDGQPFTHEAVASISLPAGPSS